MWYEDLSEELLNVHSSGTRQFLMFCARDYVQGKSLVLLELYGSDKPCSPSELAATLDLSSGRIANILKSLQEHGYVFREKDCEDARRVHVALTEKGEAKARALYDEQVAACARVFKALGRDDAEELVRILRKVSDIQP